MQLINRHQGILHELQGVVDEWCFNHQFYNIIIEQTVLIAITECRVKECKYLLCTESYTINLPRSHTEKKKNWEGAKKKILFVNVESVFIIESFSTMMIMNCLQHYTKNKRVYI